MVEHRSAESEGLEFNSFWGLRIFLCPTLVTRRKTSFSISLPSSKLTISLILFTYGFVDKLFCDFLSNQANFVYDIQYNSTLSEIQLVFNLFQSLVMEQYQEKTTHLLSLPVTIDSKWYKSMHLHHKICFTLRPLFKGHRHTSYKRLQDRPTSFSSRLEV